MRAPNKIYLQTGDHNYDDLEGEEVTWCSDRIDDTDLEYNLSLPNPCTVEQYEEITGEKFPDDGAVWCWFAMEYLGKENWYLKYYIIAKDTEWPKYIVQTGQPAPE